MRFTSEKRRNITSLLRCACGASFEFIHDSRTRLLLLESKFDRGSITGRPSSKTNSDQKHHSRYRTSGNFAFPVPGSESLFWNDIEQVREILSRNYFFTMALLGSSRTKEQTRLFVLYFPIGDVVHIAMLYREWYLRARMWCLGSWYGSWELGPRTGRARDEHMTASHA